MLEEQEEVYKQQTLSNWVMNFPLPVLVVDESGHLALTNRVFEQEFGYTREEVPDAQAWFHKVYPDESYRGEVAKDWQQSLGLMQRGETVRRYYIIRKADGSEVNTKFLAFQWIAGWYCLILEDVSLQSHMMKELQASQKKYSLLFHKSQDAVVIHDTEGQIIDVNEKALFLFGYTYGRMLEAHIRDILGDEYHHNLEFARRSAGSDLHLFTESVLKRHSGEVFNAEISASMFSIFEIAYFQVVIRDLTPRRRAEGRAELLTTALFYAAESIVITDVSGRIEYVNPAYERITGYGQDEVQGKTPAIVKSGRHDSKFYQDLWNTLKRGEVWSGHFINCKKDGMLFEEEGTISPVRDRQGNVTHYVAVKRDVTEQRQMERQLRQSQKMEAIGTLAGGIAHDFNNILTVILGYTELAILHKEEQESLSEYLKEILAGSNRARELVKQILTFSRQQENDVQPLVLSSVVKEVMKFIDSIIPKKIQVRVDISDNQGMILGNATQIHQVLMNLCSNASHAMKEKGGELRVSLEKLQVQPGDPLSRSLSSGDYLRLSVRDQGQGIEPAIVERIFDPYFTTKPRDEGTGLGLSVVDGIIREHQGHIRVDSEPGTGSVFEVYLPRLTEKPEASFSDSDSTSHGSEKILFVDDEVIIIRMAQSLLAAMGYQVDVEQSGQMALEQLRMAPLGYDLLITDMNMPGMDGIRLAEAAHHISPELPVIMCSGDSRSLHELDLTRHGISAVCGKPYQMQQIGCLIRQVMDRKS